MAKQRRTATEKPSVEKRLQRGRRCVCVWGGMGVVGLVGVMGRGVKIVFIRVNLTLNSDAVSNYKRINVFCSA